MRRPTLVVLAAGLGSRYGGLKQVEPLGPNGELALDYALYDARRAGFDRVAFVIRAEMVDAFRAVVEPRLGRLRADYVIQALDDVPPGCTLPADRAKPWGTGHAVWACRDVVQAPFVVVNADDIYGPPALAQAAALAAGVAPGVFGLVAFRLAATLSDHGPVSRGVCEIGADGHLIRVVERHGLEKDDGGARYPARDASSRPDPDAPASVTPAWRHLPGDTPVSTNLWCLTPGIFPALGAGLRRFLDDAAPGAEFLLPSVIDDLVQAGAARVQVVATGAAWLGVTHPADKATVAAGLAALVAGGVYPARLEV